ncbi:hypothetical protein Egran_05294 [Elaphomyces granulatus]|uniref:DUF4048 domain-containing protein n=1 Tax=Elaphomyces granulatus TaxID=519963 RepID=A0A232LRZ9_9EURO|nr:hypothetical protein Egran_05294 [Elaphomyces granulatus]
MEDRATGNVNTVNGDDSPEEVLSPNTSSSPTLEQPDPKQPLLPPRPNVSARHMKRLTLNFPINPPNILRSEQSSPSPSLPTPATESSLNSLPVRPVSTTPVSNDGGSDLLTAIASQERHILELREELQRAETELTNLKKQWILTERTRKRTEIHYHVEAVKQIKSPVRDSGDGGSKTPEERNMAGGDPFAVQARIGQELERRNSLRAAAASGDVSISTNGRRVFPSSKHARTLSLLSSESGVSFSQPFPQPPAEADKPERAQTSRYPRAATLPSVDRSDPTKTTTDGAMSTAEASSTQWRQSMPPPSREALMRTGKQMASDLKEGLWTFLEDIRQATVGEEGISATQSRSIQPASATSRSGTRPDRSVTPSKSREQLTPETTSAGGQAAPSPNGKEASNTKPGKDMTPKDIEVSFWSEFGVDTPGQKSKTTKAAKSTLKRRKESEDPKLLEADDNWDLWDTPTKIHTPSSSRSTIESKHDQSPSTQASSPRTSTSLGDYSQTDNSLADTSVSDGIPWPVLSKLTPSKLTRTASSLMAE